ncbi:hypothetical protein YC2023_051690 [Brassica napus]
MPHSYLVNFYPVSGKIRNMLLTTPTTAPEAAATVAQQTPQDISAQGMSGWPGSGEGSVSVSGRSIDSSRNLLTDIDLTLLGRMRP